MLKSNLKPTEKHVFEIQKWLIEEWNKTNEGFYCNWGMIPKAFTEKRLSVITKNDYAIGFVVYKIFDFTADINIAEIKPSERKKGIAKKMINETLEFFKSNNILATQLFCSPENSESFWQRIGFLSFPNLPNEREIRMFKPLVETLSSSQNMEMESTIRLWNCEPLQVNKTCPNWIWNLSFLADKKTLTKPIIFVADFDWQMEISNNQKSEKGKLKDMPIDFLNSGNLLIIKEVEL